MTGNTKQSWIKVWKWGARRNVCSVEFMGGWSKRWQSDGCFFKIKGRGWSSIFLFIFCIPKLRAQTRENKREGKTWLTTPMNIAFVYLGGMNLNLARTSGLRWCLLVNRIKTEDMSEKYQKKRNLRDFKREQTKQDGKLLCGISFQSHSLVWRGRPLTTESLFLTTALTELRTGATTPFNFKTPYRVT